MGQAAKSYRKALEENPYLWCAYRKLIELDPNSVNVTTTFTDVNPRLIDSLLSITSLAGNTPRSFRMDSKISKGVESFVTPPLVTPKKSVVPSSKQTEKLKGFAEPSVFSLYSKNSSLKKKSEESVKENNSVKPFDLESNEGDSFVSRFLTRQSPFIKGEDTQRNREEDSFESSNESSRRVSLQLRITAETSLFLRNT